MRWILSFFFRLSGWKVKGDFPRDLKKYVIVVAPHTSNWDFIIGVFARSYLRMSHARFLGKDSLFKPPYGWIFYKLGGYPVDRSGGKNIVEKVVDIMNTHDSFILTLAPEGTRSKVEKLKTGFWYMADACKIPVVPCGFDYPTKTVVIGDPYALGELESDMDFLTDFFSRLRGKHPENGVSPSV